MIERRVIKSPNGREFKIPESLHPGIEIFAINTLEIADTEFRDTIPGDVAVGLTVNAFREARKGASSEKQLEQMKRSAMLAIQRYGENFISFLQDELRLPLTNEDLELRAA